LTGPSQYIWATSFPCPAGLGPNARPPARNRSQPLGELEPRLRRPAYYKDGILSRDRADDLLPPLGVDCFRDRLGTARQRVQYEKLAHTVDGIEELRQKRFQRRRFVITAEGGGPHIASAVIRRSTDEAQLAEIAGERGLGHAPSALLEESTKLLLAPDRVTVDELEYRFVSLSLAGAWALFHGGRIAPQRHPRQFRRSGIDSPFAHYYAFLVNRTPVGVLGASGYAGRELCALILDHPELELAFATANDQRGARTRIGRRSVQFVATDDAPLGDAALVFSALPHGASKEWVARAREAGARAVDLSSDLRPGNGCEGIPYGLTELARERVRGAHLVSNPGCYPTAILTALAPLIERGLIADDATIVIDAASGVTGAGNSPKRELLFAEVSDDYRAYGFANGGGNVHRHLNEMRAFAGELGSSADLVFTPHLLPTARGILATITVPLRAPISGDVLGPWRERFEGEPFIEVTGEPPALRDVVHRNVVRIAAMPLHGVRRPTLLVLSAIDNLVKGAAGQALQNANLMLGISETVGLPA